LPGIKTTDYSARPGILPLVSGKQVFDLVARVLLYFNGNNQSFGD
jgi:hypothetical protein